MAFTHYTPTANRLYGTAWSKITTFESRGGYTCYEESSTKSSGYSATSVQVGCNSTDIASGRYDTGSGSTEIPNNQLTVVGASTNSGETQTQSWSSGYSLNTAIISRSSTQSIVASGASNGNTARNTYVTIRVTYDDYSESYRSFVSQTFYNYSASARVEVDDSFKTNENGFTQSRGSTLVSSTVRAGATDSNSGTRYTSLTNAQTTYNNQEPPPAQTPPTTVYNSATFVNNPSPVEVVQRTSLGETTVRLAVKLTAITTSSVSYSYLSGTLATDSSSYSFNTTKITGEQNETMTHEAYVDETITLDAFYDSLYTVYSIHGGAAYITGGSVLPNAVVVGATLTTVNTSFASLNYPESLNEYSTEFYRGSKADQQDKGFLETTELTNVITTVSVEETKIRTTYSDIVDPADFGRSTSRAKIFETTTFRSDFQQESQKSGRNATVTQQEQKGGTVQFEGYTSVIETVTGSYMASDGFSSYSYGDILSSFTTYQHAQTVGANQTSEILNRTDKKSFGIPRLSKFTGYHTAKSIPTFWTYDKGDHGGIQNQTSDDVSGAVRSTRENSIADQVITTTTYTSPAATITITANSAESSSYTFSAGLALELELKLNRYLTFFPDEKYGDIVSSIDSMQYSYSFDENGQSIIRFTSTGTYSTSGTFSDGSVKTTKSFSSELFGMAKVGLGAVYEDGQKTKPTKQENQIKGGQNFTQREGVLVYKNVSPTFTFAVFGASSSSIISIGEADIGGLDSIRTLPLPIGSVCFHQGSTFVLAGNDGGANAPGVGGLTYDRKHRLDADNYYPTYYYPPYYYY
jgi:hypothetical protein